MKRLLYYRSILSGFTPLKVLLKDRLSSTPQKYPRLYLRVKNANRLMPKSSNTSRAESHLFEDPKAAQWEFQKPSVSQFNSFTRRFLSPL